MNATPAGQARPRGYIDPKYVPYLVPAIMAIAMSFTMSLVQTIARVGFSSNLPSAWLTSFAIGVAVAIPTAIFIAPRARRLAGHLTGTPPSSEILQDATANQWADLPVPGTRFIVSVARGQWPEGVTIIDAQGTSQFDIAGSSSLETLSLRVPGGRELAVVQRHVPTGGFEVVAGDRQLALVRQRFGRYWISISGEDIAMRGRIEGGSYVLVHAGYDLAVVSPPGLSLTEEMLSGLPSPQDLLRRPDPRLVVDIKPGNEPAIMLAAVLAIEWLYAQR